MKRKGFYLLCLFSFFIAEVNAQQNQVVRAQQPYKEVKGIEPKDQKHKTYATMDHGDTIPVGYLSSIYVYPREKFKSEKDERYYWKLVRDVKKVYPLSKIVYYTLSETMDYVATLPDQKSRDQHLKKMEHDLIKQYEPVLRKMTYSQGKILIKLIDRECKTSSYELIRAYRGSFSAGFWQGVGKLFHIDLKSEYDPVGEDYLLERVVIKVEQGQL